jgi:hypothetical protein
MEQQELDQEQEVVVWKEILGSGKIVICNPNHQHHHPEDRTLEERMQEKKTPEEKSWKE